MARTYEAIVCGSFREDSGTVDAPIGRHPSDRKKMTVTLRNSKEAVTHWEVVCRYRGYTHIRCRLETGRTHQIRVHMAHIGHPLVGDFLYGTEDKTLIGRTALHSHRLEFAHPITGETMTFEQPLPPDMEQLV
jgi:23S rRNA pseudouridine1911/1915/1917 synthase